MWTLRVCFIVATLTVRATSPFLFSNRFPFGPRTNGGGVTPTEQVEPSSKRIPKFMMQLYRMVATSEGLLKHGMPYNVNSIRGIYSKRILKLSPAKMEMYYDIGYLKQHYTARRDEIHLYMKQLNASHKYIFRPYILSLHDIYTGKLIRKFKVPAFNHGWQVLSLRGWSNRWARDPTSNKGLRLTVYRGRRKKLANQNPFVEFPKGKDPYMILFGDDNDNNLLGWRFLNGYPMNSVGDYGATRSGRRRRMTSRQTQASPQCVATLTSIKLKGRKINNEYFIVEPENYKIAQCPKTCRLLPRQAGNPPQTKRLLAQKLTRVCCVPQHFEAVGFLVTEPTRQTVTFASVLNVAPTSCTWSAS